MNVGISKSIGMKVLSIGLITDDYCPFCLSLCYNNKGDHFGWDFMFTLFNIRFYIDLYDCRHWNYKEDRPETLEDSLAEDKLNEDK